MAALDARKAKSCKILLTEQERCVLICLSRGYLNGRNQKMVAVELKISVHTLNFHLRNIFRKMGVNSQTAAIMKFAAMQ